MKGYQSPEGHMEWSWQSMQHSWLHVPPNVNLELEEKSWDHQRLSHTSSGRNLMAIHHMVFEIYESGSEAVSDRPMPARNRL